jgi:hypothetical protein
VTATARQAHAEPVGHARPRLGPPVPARSGWGDFTQFAKGLGIDLFPWQQHAARFLTAKGDGDRWLYREVAVIVARQNGKTTLLIPLIAQRLLAGQSIMHAAQNARLPREVHEEVVDLLREHYPKELAAKRSVSYAVGHEVIKLRSGGQYRIVAPTRSGARGTPTDLVIVDELREMEDHDFIAAAKPTLTASASPQILYLSNAGTDQSVILNGLRKRAGEDPSLAYLEWSASPDRQADDFAGWLEANPAIGHKPGVVDTLHDEYRANRLGGTLAIFETEHLCRWVQSMREPLVDAFAFAECEGPAEAGAKRYMAVAMSPDGTRASAALAWRTPSQQLAVRLLFNVTGSPIDTDALGRDLEAARVHHGAQLVGYDPLTDRELAKFHRQGKQDRLKSITGQEFANASARFALAVESRQLRWQDAAAVGDDLTWTTRKPHDESGSYQAVRADDDRPITAALAAIRAVWLASEPPKTGEARIW